MSFKCLCNVYIEMHCVDAVNITFKIFISLEKYFIKVAMLHNTMDSFYNDPIQMIVFGLVNQIDKKLYFK